MAKMSRTPASFHITSVRLPKAHKPRISKAKMPKVKVPRINPTLPKIPDALPNQANPPLE